MTATRTLKVERFIGRIKQYRRGATRYEKTASSYLAVVQVAAIMTLLLWIVHTL